MPRDFNELLKIMESSYQNGEKAALRRVRVAQDRIDIAVTVLPALIGANCHCEVPLSAAALVDFAFAYADLVLAQAAEGGKSRAELPLYQPEAPRFFEVTDATGRKLFISWRGSAWMEYHSAAKKILGEQAGPGPNASVAGQDPVLDTGGRPCAAAGSTPASPAGLKTISGAPAEGSDAPAAPGKQRDGAAVTDERATAEGEDNPDVLGGPDAVAMTPVETGGSSVPEAQPKGDLHLNRIVPTRNGSRDGVSNGRKDPACFSDLPAKFAGDEPRSNRWKRQRSNWAGGIN